MMQPWATRLAAIFVAAGLLGCATSVAPHATIVPQGVYSRDGVKASEALSIKDPDSIRRLESFFPGYQRMPGSGLFGSWISGYDVFIDDGSSRAVHIVVSYDAQYWEVGKGDLEVAGDFERFVKELREKSAR